MSKSNLFPIYEEPEFYSQDSAILDKCERVDKDNLERIANLRGFSIDKSKNRLEICQDLLDDPRIKRQMDKFIGDLDFINEEIYKKYSHHFNKNTGSVDWKLTDIEKKKLINQFPDIKLSYEGELDFTEHENNNSFSKILATKYFNGEYATINLGRNGSGNRAAIKELYFYPDILWDLLTEIIVIYCPTGAERLDFMDDHGLFMLI